MPIDKDVWHGFCGELESRSAHLASELSISWRDLCTLTGSLWANGAFQEPAGPAERLESLEASFGDVAQRLLVDLLAAYQQRRPLQRTLSAMREHESVLDDLERRLPRVAEFSGRDLVELLGDRGGAWVRRWRAWQRTVRAVPFRDIVSAHLERLILERAVLDGAFQVLLAQSALHLLAPWQLYRRASLLALAKSGREKPDFGRDYQWWAEFARRQEARATALLARYGAWAESISPRLAIALLRRPVGASDRKRAKRAEEHERYVSFWSRQQRAVLSMFDLELHFAKLARQTTQETRASLQALEAEHEELKQELDTAIAWLESWPQGEAPESLPPPKARLLASEERLSEWQRRVSGSARQELPVTIETVEPRQALPGFRKPWRELEPRRIFLGALERTGTPILLGGLQEAEGVHRAIVREIERAREVVAFGYETAKSEAGAGETLVREAVGNSLSLLEYQKGVTPDIRPAAEASAVHAEAAALLDCDIAFEKGRIGVLAHVTRQRSGEALRQMRDLALQGIRFASRKFWAGVQRCYRWALLQIGWITAPRPVPEPVVRRAQLGETLEVQLHVRELPMIYRRLFRLAPVEDSRFLVGRDAELAGLADALAHWEAGRGASVIVIGARGSGKTSLINCAASDMFSGFELARGQFCERLTSRGQMEGFLRNLLKTPAEADVATALRTGRRVVLVEEFERTFLRAINGFEALRALLSLMYATARSTLWVFSINETAYQFLDAVVGLGRHFSHHVNAMSVRQEDLTNAILQRHGLSGLRLEFAPLPEEDPRVSGARRFLGFEQDPQKLFLDSLYEQSEGIFRSAFELWQGCIERVEGGVVHMRQPLSPDFRTLIEELALEDAFALKAILQHGSLTADEVAQVLATRPEDCLRQVERLQLLEVLEPEPVCPGLRVRPEAGRLVRETLNRRNLL